MKMLLMVLSMVVLFAGQLVAQDKKPAAARFENEIKAYEQADQKALPPENAVLFAGASGIRLWKTLEQDFPEHKVINRGFGGSQISDNIHYADRIIIPYKPRLIVFQAGGNDIAAGKSPEQVAEDFKVFVEKVRGKLPDVKIAYFSIQPSPARVTQMDKQKVANKLI